MRLGEPGFTTDFKPLLNLIGQRIKLANREKPCEAGPGFVVPAPPDGPSFAAVVDFVCAEPVTELTVRDDLSDVLGADYHTLAKIEWRGGVQQFAFQADSRETRVTVATAGESSGGVGSFFLLGIEHILSGYDHLLFLLALVLRGGNIWSLLKIITAFTVAHSITLGLAALNIVTLPERLVEATIALSIAYVAAENLFMRHTVSHRWAVAFLFGLMHGFGFSNVLRELGLPKEGLVWALLNFNLGVEAGQAIAVVVAVPLLMWLRRFRWEPRAVAAVSALVLVVGLALFVDRAFLTSPDARAVMDVIPQSPLCLTSAQIAPRTRISVLPGPGLRGRRSPAPRSTGHSYSCRRPLSMRTKTTASEHRP
jgi:hydrogenase/urease accessory protein HupE